MPIVIGRTHNSLCPVAALLSYLAIRGNRLGFLFLFADGRPLTKSRFILKIREALSLVEIDSSQYAGHSFRIGATTTAAAQGIQDSVIQMLGRWKSSAYQLYIRTPKDKLARYSSIIAAWFVNPGLHTELYMFAWFSRGGDQNGVQVHLY